MTTLKYTQNKIAVFIIVAKKMQNIPFDSYFTKQFYVTCLYITNVKYSNNYQHAVFYSSFSIKNSHR